MKQMDNSLLWLFQKYFSEACTHVLSHFSHRDKAFGSILRNGFFE